jgi:hypothetical protein
VPQPKAEARSASDSRPNEVREHLPQVVDGSVHAAAMLALFVSGRCVIPSEALLLYYAQLVRLIEAAQHQANRETR